MQTDPIVPSTQTLEKYANLLINFALGHGEGIQRGDVVECVFPVNAKPLAKQVQLAVLRAGGHPLMTMYDDALDADFFKLSTSDQLTFFPEKYLHEKAKLLDHQVMIVEPTYLDYTAQMIENRQIYRSLNRQFHRWTQTKEQNGLFSWTKAYWGNEGAAAHLGVPLTEYWQKMSEACKLDRPDPAVEWQATFARMRKLCDQLTNLSIQKLIFTGPDIELTMAIGQERKWLGASGRNIPSYEVFTSPIWQSVQGWIRCNVPLYRPEGEIGECFFRFEDGTLTEARAATGDDILQKMLEVPGMKRVGEISLTDKTVSTISAPIGIPLYDENIGGAFGNTHFALGEGFTESYIGETQPESSEDWLEKGINMANGHVDFISTTQRKVVAELADQKSITLYENGVFLLPE